MKHLDKHGRELAVGDNVLWGNREGTVLILEDWDNLGRRPGLPRWGCYVSDIGWWGDCKAVEASQLVKVGA
jgi:hypothetical protein